MKQTRSQELADAKQMTEMLAKLTQEERSNLLCVMVGFDLARQVHCPESSPPQEQAG